MSLTEIYRAWATLLALSLATTGLTIVNVPSATLTAGLLLALSGLKARTILARYLELNRSAFWMKLFDAIVWLFLLMAFGLYLVGSGRAS